MHNFRNRAAGCRHVHEMLLVLLPAVLRAVCAGLSVADLIALKEAGKSVCDHATGQKLPRDAVIDVECDIWIPAARPDVLREDNAHRLKARLVLQGATIPFTEAAEDALDQRGVLVIPDFSANATAAAARLRLGHTNVAPP